MRTRHRSEASSGFTLLEMLIVVAVLGLVLGMIVLRGPVRSQGLDTRAAAREVAGTLRAARARAITTDRPVLFLLDPAHHAFQVEGSPPRTLPTGLNAALLSRAQLGQRPLSAISFAPDGSSSGGAVVLADGHHRLAVSVDWLTGRVSIASGQ